MILRTSAIIITLLIAMASAVMAQEPLQQEITVEHTPEVEPRHTPPLQLQPQVSLTSPERVPLAYNQTQIPVTPRTGVTLLAPAAYADTIYRSPYSGYATLGYMPIYNATASAGYKILDTDHTRLNAWLQYDGSAYRQQAGYATDKIHTWSRSNTLTIATGLRQAVGNESFVDFGIDYTAARYNTPAMYTEHALTGLFAGYDQQIARRLNMQGLLSTRFGDIDASLGLGYNHFGYGKSFTAGLDPDPRATRENRFTAQAMLQSKYFGGDPLTLAVEASVLRTGYHLRPYMASDQPQVIHYAMSPHYTQGLLTLRPKYTGHWHTLMYEVGLKAEFTVHSGRVFHIAPDAQVTWRPSPFVAGYIKAGGGEVQNTLSSLYDVTPHALQVFAYRNSHLPITAEFGATVGQWKGFSSQISIELARANDWLMPAIDQGLDLMMFRSQHLSGYCFNITTAYTHSSWLTTTVTYKNAPQSMRRGYYLWRDRARHVVEANVSVNPWKPLTITADYHLRADRRIAATNQGTGTLLRLGNLSTLNLAGYYRYTPQLTFFLKGTNLLNHRYTELGGFQAQGISGMMGASYKF